MAEKQPNTSLSGLFFALLLGLFLDRYIGLRRSSPDGHRSRLFILCALLGILCLLLPVLGCAVLFRRPSRSFLLRSPCLLLGLLLLLQLRWRDLLGRSLLSWLGGLGISVGSCSRCFLGLRSWYSSSSRRCFCCLIRHGGTVSNTGSLL